MKIQFKLGYKIKSGEIIGTSVSAPSYVKVQVINCFGRLTDRVIFVHKKNILA